MCRIAAWSGDDIALDDIIVRPSHSLLTQSQHADEAKLAVNGDGFGIAWYGLPKSPGLYRDVLPAWADGNLESLCRTVRAQRFIAHIRASTMGETSRANCHPFVWDNWSFCHNGQIPHYPQIRRKLETALPDALYDHRRGTTDSEALFLTLLSNGLTTRPAEAFARTLEMIGPARSSGPVRLTCVFSDGTNIWGLRHASDGKSPTLYLSDTIPGGRAFASEPLCGDARKWTRLPNDTLTMLRPDGSVLSQPLVLASPVMA